MPKAPRHFAPRDTSRGKGRVYVNNQPATVNVLRQLAPELALVHARSGTMGSFVQAQQRQLLDRSAASTRSGSVLPSRMMGNLRPS